MHLRQYMRIRIRAVHINIQKSGAGASVKPGIPDAKGNQFFCVRAGTTVVWMTSSKNTGFSISFGTDSPFIQMIPLSAAEASR